MIRIGIWLPLVCIWGALSTQLLQAQTAHVDSPTWQLAVLIDQLVEQAAVGPLATICSDADFLRRVTLDLTGVIPSAERTQDFLNDASLDKRQREIERLVASPEFNRFMTLQLSVTLLERRAEKNIPLRSWERFLFESLEADKPLDQLMSELVYADPATAQHPANKFILSREVEPNAVTRDVGRLALGMDLQCAQCHNHPLIDSYHQADYYGLYAFLHRTILFTQPSTKQVKLAEKPDGEASFRSVFTGAARDHTTPRLPKEFSLLDEPVLLGDAIYVEKPGKESGGLPAHSRRQALAKMLRGSRQFQRNVANRLWALMFARGIVHPLDFHHRDNAPANPQLLDALTEALVASGYKIRPLLSGIAMSRCYQRSCEPPAADAINFTDIAARGESIQGKLSSFESATESLKTAAAQADLAYNDLLAKHDAHAIELSKVVKEASDAQASFHKAEEAFQKADGPFQKSRAQSEALAAAAGKLTEALTLLKDDKELVDASSIVKAKAQKVASSLVALEKAAQEKQTLFDKAKAEQAYKQSALASLQAARPPIPELQALEKGQVETSRNLSDHLFRIDQAKKQIELCKYLLDYQALKQTDASKAAAQWLVIVDRWTELGQIAPLKPLTPEQLTLSAMQGTGVLAKHVSDATTQAKAIRAKAEAAKAKAVEKAAEKAGEKSADKTAGTDKTTTETEVLSEAAASLAALEQQKLIDTVRSRLDQFATLYGGLPGEDFQATVNQALFFGNGNVVDEWLKVGQNNLTDELIKLDVDKVADKMFLTVLSREPNAGEKQDVHSSLTAEGIDRPQVINRWLWALLSSSEFRFNH